MGTIIGLIIAVLDIWAILNILQSKESTISKAIWTVVILALPFVGLVIWYFLGPGTKRMCAHRAPSTANQPWRCQRLFVLHHLSIPQAMDKYRYFQAIVPLKVSSL